MKTVNLVQGSPEWHAHRMQHFNASDAPAMMGVSPYKTRAQLIKEVATGLTEEIDPQTQRLFDDGHRTEALARPIAEEIIGEDLSPVVGTNGTLSASFDGLTFLYDKSFECKRLNKRLREAMFPGCTGADLPLDYQVQMEQQHAVNDKGEATLFIAAEFDADGKLVEERHCWYTPNLELRAKIIAGWKQFEADVAAWKPAEVAAELVAEPVEMLPAVVVKVSGELSVVANLGAFETKLRDFLDNRLIRKPKTDQDFVNLDLQIKAMKNGREAIKSAKAQALAQVEPVDVFSKTADMLDDLLQKNCAMAEKLLKDEKERRKADIVLERQASLREHVETLTKRVGVLVSVAADFGGVIKSLKSLASMEDKLDGELARAKIEASRIADLIDANRKAMEAADAAGLFPDFGTVCTKAPEDFANLVTSRRAAAEARIEAERARIRAEEAARLEREAAAKREAEERAQRAAAEAKAFEEAEAQRRAAAEAKAKADAEARAAQQEEALRIERERDQAAAHRTSLVDYVPPTPAPAPEVRAFPAAAANEEPTLSLGDIKTRIAPLSIDAAGLEALGFPAKKVKASCMYRESAWPAIHAALVKKLTAAGPQQLAA